jgi:hypothetical protein
VALWLAHLAIKIVCKAGIAHTKTLTLTQPK